MKKTSNRKTYLDPIHGQIQLNLNDKTDNLLSQIIDSIEFQKLRRVHQMGLGWFTFHGAEHTRFGHSIGAMYIAKKMLNHLSETFKDINSYKTEILVAALIHDIGHGPFSHTSEKPTGFNHEDWTTKIINSNSSINSILKNFNKNLPELVTKILSHKPEQTYLSQIISSYVDCDRLDYLHRDSYYVGVPYGLTGSDRIIESLEIDKSSNKLVIRENVGLDAVIHYLHARHSMYKQVYQHKKNLASDFMLRKIIERAKELKPNNIPDQLKSWLNYENKSIKGIDTDSYIKVDDFLLISTIQIWAYNSGDKILQELCERFISRKLFKSLEFREDTSKEKINEAFQKVEAIAKKKLLSANYFIGIEESASKPYEPYQITNKKKEDKAIFVKQQNGLIKELSEVSGLVKALSKENIVKTCLVFTPQIEDEITNLKGFEELFK